MWFRLRQNPLFFAALFIALYGVTSCCVAGAEVSAEKIRAYAEIYPDLFQNPSVSVSNTGGGGHSRTVSLLLQSFNNNTDVEELTAVLRPKDVAALKPESQIKPLLAQKGLSWEDYTSVTHSIASNPQDFQTFLSKVDKAKLQNNVLARLNNDPQFIRSISSLDQQVIVRNLADSNHFKL